MRVKISRIKNLIILVLILLCGTVLVSCKKEEKILFLDSLEVQKLPNKYEYIEGDSFDITGAQILAHFKNNIDEQITKEDVTSYLTFSVTTVSSNLENVTASYKYLDITKSVSLNIHVTPKLSSIEETTLTVLNKVGTNNSTSYWYLEKYTNYVLCKVIVNDDDIVLKNSITNSDSIELTISSFYHFKGIKDGTLKIKVTADGLYTINKYLTNTYFLYDTNNILINTSLLAKDGSISVYQIEINIPNTEINGLTEELGLYVSNTNKTSSGLSQTKGYDDFDTNESLCYTYIYNKESNLFTHSPYYQYGATWGNTNNLSVKGNWNLDNDDFTENKSITLTSASGDNNIYMYKDNSKNLLARASFTALSVSNNESAPKFGLNVTTPSNEGFFFYIDAAVNNGSFIGTKIGYVLKNTNAYYGNWTEFTNKNVITSPNSYQGNNSVELAIYRYEELFLLYCNGVEVYRLCSPKNIGFENAYFGIVSFNTLIKVTKYELTSEQSILNTYNKAPLEIDNLFTGDSYVDTCFWKDYFYAFGTESANIAVGGTKTEYWDSADMVNAITKAYNPSALLIHIGVNDINGGKSSAKTISDIKALYASYLEKLPNMKIYYYAMNINNFAPGNYTKYQTVNNNIKDYSQNNNNLEYIDIDSIFGSAAGNAVGQFLQEGLHFNFEGYALWTKATLQALGITRSEGNSILGDNNIYAYTSGFNFDSGGIIVKNIALGDQSIWYKNISGGDFYVEIKINALGALNRELYPKIGFSIKSVNKSLFYYIDALNNYSNKTGNYVIKNTTGQWDWSAVGSNFGIGNVDYYMNYKTLGMLRFNNKIYFISDGNIVKQIDDIFSEEQFGVSLYMFNTEAVFKDAMLLTSSIEVENKLNSYNI
ncbi:MAG: GDSL-type esterase/lipase family protein [Acholeplasmatales bacterium]|jgi:lysophospholipase L1-like esterase|nr:GDSL-type esterase/lipase family protein [Acholeplasmatales bacterium]